jgi:uncharacterized membrane protein
LLLNNNSDQAKYTAMKHTLIISALILGLAASTASAACVAEYKAKRDNPLRLDYGTVVVQGNNCTASGVQSAVKAQLASQGWTLLSILSVKKSG